MYQLCLRSGKNSGCFSSHWVTEQDSLTACCCTDLKEKETAPAAARGAADINTHGKVTHTDICTQAGTCCQQEGACALPFNTLPLSHKPHWHNDTQKSCKVINLRAEVRAARFNAQHVPNIPQVLCVYSVSARLWGTEDGRIWRKPAAALPAYAGMPPKGMEYVKIMYQHCKLHYIMTEMG